MTTNDQIAALESAYRLLQSVKHNASLDGADLNRLEDAMHRVHKVSDALTVQEADAYITLVTSR